MKTLFTSAAALAAVLLLSGCPYHRQPVPGPQSSWVQPALGAAHRDAGRRAASQAPHPGAIGFFQGSLDEAFSRTPCEQPRARLHD